MTKVRARAVVVAQGAVEQPAVFRGNDLPGVMLASGAQRLLNRYGVAPASRVVVVTANAEGYLAALDAFHHGITVAGVLDLRERSHASESEVVGAIRDRGIVVFHGVKPVEARAGADHHLREIEFDVEISRGRFARHYLAADGLWMSVGFAPANALLHQAGAKMRYEAAIEQFVPSRLPAGVFACGKVAGAYGLNDRLAQGREAGRLAAAHASRGMGVPPDTDGGETLRLLQSLVIGSRGSPSHPFPIFPHPKGKEFVDLDEDLQLCDLANAFQEGFDSSELLKRYTTVGMGPEPGQAFQPQRDARARELREESVEAVGPTTARPMFHPVPLRIWRAAVFIRSVARLCMTSMKARRGVDAGGRLAEAEYYAVPGRIARAEHRCRGARRAQRRGGHRCRHVRQDRGRTVRSRAEFLDRVYTGRFQHAESRRHALRADAG